MSEFEKKLNEEKLKRSLHSKQMAVICITIISFVIIFILYSKSFFIDIVNEKVDKYSISILDGFGFSFGDRVYPILAVENIKVSAFGYKDESINITDLRYAHIPVILNPAPVTLTISAKDQLEKPRWFLNTKLVSTSLELNQLLIPGEYDIRLESSFHEDLIFKVALSIAQDKTLQISPEPSIIDLSIESLPLDADIYLNDEYFGKSPIRLSVAAGQYKINIHKDLYKRIEEFILLDNLELSFSRNYLLVAEKRRTKLKLAPSGGSLRVNDKLLKNNDNIFLNETGLNVLSYSKPGHESKTIKFQGFKNTVEVNLDPINILVSIDTSPPDVSVYVNNTYIGRTPLKKSMLGMNHTLLLKKEGHVSISKLIRPNQVYESKYKFELETIIGKKIRESRSSYMNSIGSELIRISPDSFVMGSDDMERGRRSDEFQRNIEFTRHFFISRHEVTNKQFGFFQNGSKSNGEPVTNITWDSAARFCNWLSEKEGFDKVYIYRDDVYLGADLNADGYRLPTEAEWEYMAKTYDKPKETIFVWGDRYETNKLVGNLADNAAKGVAKRFISSYSDSFADLAKVGSFKEEASGLFDQSGNVSEWVHDFYSFTPPDAEVFYKDFSGSTNKSDHVVKGSNYLSSSWTELRASYRATSNKPSTEIGFRLARYLY